MNEFRAVPRMRSIAAACLPALLVCGCASPGSTKSGAARTDAPPQTIRVGAWNIEWLGNPQNRSGPAKNHAQAAVDLAEYIADADVAILGLEEIAQTEGTDPPTNETISAALKIVEKKRGGHWKHVLFPARSGKNQNVGLAWDESHVTRIGEPVCITAPPETNAQGYPIWPRPPYAVTFSAGPGLTDFVVIPIHMKSNFGGDFSEQRATEARALVRDLPSQVSDADVLIIGDSNCNKHSEPGIAVLESAGFVDLNAADATTFWRGSVLDRAFVPTSQPEFAARRFEVRREAFLNSHGLTEEQFKVRFSDHFMVVTEIAVMADDD